MCKLHVLALDVFACMELISMRIEPKCPWKCGVQVNSILYDTDETSKYNEFKSSDEVRGVFYCPSSLEIGLMTT